MAGMILPRVMRNRLSTRSALMSSPACMKSRRSITARPLEVRSRLKKSRLPSASTWTFSRNVSRFEGPVVGLDLVAGIEAVGLDEQPARLEAAEAAVAIERAAVVLDQPGALVALAGEHLASGARLAVGAEGDEQREAGQVGAVGGLRACPCGSRRAGTCASPPSFTR